MRGAVSLLDQIAGRAGSLFFGGTVRGMLGGPGQDRLREAVGDKVVLVTGASAGLGEAVARRVGAAGARVALVARTEDALARIGGEIESAGGTAYVHPTDMGDLEAVGRLTDELLAVHGGADVLISNAGISIRRSLELSYQRFHDFERTIRVNYLGPVKLALALLPGMRERGHGHVVSVSTIGVQFPDAPRYAAYLASKAAFDTWLRAAAPEVRADGVACTSMYFGLIHTRMSGATSLYRLMPGQSPQQAAADVCSALVHRQSMTGPLWLRGAALAAEAGRGALDPALSLYYRLSEDSARARGEEGGGLEIPVLEGLARRARLGGRR